MTWVHSAGFFRQLSVLTRTGMPIVNALRLAGDTAGRDYRRAADRWATGCSQGQDLASQLAAAHEPPLVVALVRAGETTGRLPELCARIADHFSQLVALRGLAVGKLIYPVFLLHMALIVPMIPQVFADASPWWLLAGPLILWAVVAGLVVAGKIWHEAGVLARIALLPGPRFLTMPFLTCNTCLVLAAAMAAGMKVRDALELAAEACGNRRFATRLHEAASAVESGSLPNLTMAVRQAGLPERICDLIASGEQSGTLEVVLDQAAVAARESFQSRMTWATKIFTSVIYAAVVVYVGWTVISMYTGLMSHGIEAAGGDPYG